MPDIDDTPSTKLVIPYFSGDTGARPLPSIVVSWLCPGIRTSGTPTPGVFAPGVPLGVTVDVTNHGAGTGAAPVYVTVWWTDPNTGFALNASNVFGQATVAVPSHGATVTTPEIVGTIPATAPSHVCLIARAVSPADTLPKGAIADPVNDRHWAQLNLNAIATASQGGFQFTFWAVNPRAERASYEIVLRPVRGEALDTLARHLGREAVEAEGVRLRLEEREDPAIRLELQPGARRRLTLDGALATPLHRHAFTAVEALQLEGDQLAGSLGLVLYGVS